MNRLVRVVAICELRGENQFRAHTFEFPIAFEDQLWASSAAAISDKEAITQLCSGLFALLWIEEDARKLDDHSKPATRKKPTFQSITSMIWFRRFAPVQAARHKTLPWSLNQAP